MLTLIKLTCSHLIRPPAFLASLTLELVEKVLVGPTRYTNPATLDAVALYFLSSEQF